MHARRFVRALPLIAVMSAACTSQPAPAEKPAEAPRPEWTADQSAQKYTDCWDQFNRKDWNAFRSCYGPTVAIEAVDSGRPVVSGLEAGIKDAQDFVAAFPDVTGSLQLVLASKDSVAGLAVVTGTHGGPRCRAPAASQSRPPTGRSAT